jgi:hypothetical protein
LKHEFCSFTTFALKYVHLGLLKQKSDGRPLKKIVLHDESYGPVSHGDYSLLGV